MGYDGTTPDRYLLLSDERSRSTATALVCRVCILCGNSVNVHRYDSDVSKTRTAVGVMQRNNKCFCQ